MEISFVIAFLALLFIAVFKALSKTPEFRTPILLGLLGLLLLIGGGFAFWQSDSMKKGRYERGMQEGEQMMRENRIMDAYRAFTHAQANQDTPFVRNRIAMCKSFVDAVRAGDVYTAEQWYAKAIKSYDEALRLFPNAPEPKQKQMEAERKLAPLMEQAQNFAENYVNAHNNYLSNDLDRMFDESVQYKGQKDKRNVDQTMPRVTYVNFIRSQIDRFSTHEYSLSSQVTVEPSLNLNRYKVFFEMDFKGVGRNTGASYLFSVQKQLTLKKVNGEMRVTYDAGTIIYKDSYRFYDEE